MVFGHFLEAQQDKEGSDPNQGLIKNPLSSHSGGPLLITRVAVNPKLLLLPAFP